MVRIQSTLKYLPRLSLYSIGAVCISILLLFVLLSQYSHPAADDFCMARGVKQDGLVGHLWNHYFEWSGRYSGNALYALYPELFGLFEGYHLIPIILIVSLGIAVVFLITTMVHAKRVLLLATIASMAFISVYMLGMSRIASGFYWMAGAFTYQTGNILFLLLIALLIRLYDQQSMSLPYGKTLSLLIPVSFIAVGLNETIMLATMGVLVLASSLVYRSGKIKLKPWLILLAIASIGFCIVYFAPGNTVRSSHFPLRNDVLHAISGSWNYGLQLLKSWVSEPVFISSIFLVPFFVTRLYSETDREFYVTFKQLIFLLLLMLLVPFIFSFPSWWAIGVGSPPRTVNTIYFLFLLSTYAAIAALTLYIVQNRMGSKLGESSAASGIIISAASLIFIYFLFENDRFAVVVGDFKLNARTYDQYLNERYQIIKESLDKKMLAVTVPRYEYNYPHVIYFDDITDNPEDWRNTCYADYFGLESIHRQ